MNWRYSEDHPPPPNSTPQQLYEFLNLLPEVLDLALTDLDFEEEEELWNDFAEAKRLPQVEYDP